MGDDSKAAGYSLCCNHDIVCADGSSVCGKLCLFIPQKMASVSEKGRISKDDKSFFSDSKNYLYIYNTSYRKKLFY